MRRSASAARRGRVSRSGRCWRRGRGESLPRKGEGGRRAAADGWGSSVADRRDMLKPARTVMENGMTIADMVYEQVKALPEPLAREVLDFVSFLRERGERPEWRDLMNAQAGSLAPLWDNAEDKVWDDA